MAGAGAKVLLVDIDEAQLTASEKRIRDRGGNARTLVVDVAEPAAPTQIVDCALEHFGSLTVVVHSAGVHEQAPFTAMTPRAFDRAFAVNVRAPYFITQQALPHLSPGGCVIFIGSTGAIAAIPGGFSAYCASKGAVHSLMRTLAVELAPRDVRVNEILPGAFDTPINAAAFRNDPGLAQGIIEATPVRRLGAPDDIVAPALFLASDGARHVHGASLVVDGGFTVA
jgi:NAD(P)-dependent dehydrogenase (short-subunit alcohol dehydrogenase family)